MEENGKKTRRDDTIPLFLSFCIEQYAHRQQIGGADAMRLLLDSGALNYLEDNYEALHTQSPQWILEEVTSYLSTHPAK